jgi:hypothetical protein
MAARPIPARPAGGAVPEPPAADGVRIVAPAELRRATEMLREDAARLTLPLDVEDAMEARRELESLIGQLDDYLLPRLRRIDAPLLAVVGGSTGAGKSTLVNSLVQRFVTRPGVLRPTTRSPVLVHHPFDSSAFLTQRILPGLARVTCEEPEPLRPIDLDAPRVTALRLVPERGLAPGLALVDAPDIDSLIDTNRDLAAQLLGAADLWVFVTTASRYSDAAPWEMLRTAVDRGVSVAVVLNRVPRTAMNEIRVDLARLLRDRGLSTAPLFAIPDSRRDADGFLPRAAVAPLHGWLGKLARDSRARDVVVRRTLVGTLDSLRERVETVVAAAERQAGAYAQLTQSFTTAFADGERQLTTVLSDASLLRGEVLARWQEYSGNGDIFRGLDGTPARLLDRLSAAITRGRPADADPLGAGIGAGIEAAITTTLRATGDRVTQAWGAHPCGSAVLRELDAGPAPGPDSGLRPRDTVSDWQSAVLSRVRDWADGAGHPSRQTVLGAEGVAVLLEILALGRAGPGSVPMVDVASSVARAVLGQDVDGIVSAVHSDLMRRAGLLLIVERERFATALGRTGVRDDLAPVLRDHLRAIEEAR